MGGSGRDLQHGADPEEFREKGNFHDQDSDNKFAEYIAKTSLQGNATFFVFCPAQGSKNYVN
jgi:hypothetical protein